MSATVVRAPVRLGIVGCGAVTQVCHLPAARRVPEVRVGALADTNPRRAALLARRFDVPRWSTDYRTWVDDVDGVIVAVPHALHLPLAETLLRRGRPVLMEKPLAISTAELEAMAAIVRETGTPLVGGYMYRHNRAAHLVRRILSEGWLGRLERFTLEFGVASGWPAASGFYWDRQQAGGGVLIDSGSHMLDLLLWWLGDVEAVVYRDDSRGGVEAECHLDLTLRGAQGAVSGTVVLSRLRDLPGVATIVGEDFVLECTVSPPYEVRLRPRRPAGQPAFTADDAGRETFSGMFVQQLRAFAATVRGAPSPVPVESVRPTVALIERCYRERAGRLPEAWSAPLTVAARPTPACVTGATGFIGGRLAEVLVEEGAEVTALVRRWSQAARLARLPVRMVGGDVLDLASLRQAMAGCRVVYHCAFSFAGGRRGMRRLAVHGTRAVLQAALEAGVERVVLLSTVAVHGVKHPAGVITEEMARGPTGHPYGDAKLAAEAVALAFHRRTGLPVTILRPAVVYGPYGGAWTVEIVRLAREGRLALVNGGEGVCNPLYVDNLVQAMLLAATHPAAVGQVFHVTDGSPVTWRRFLEAHVRGLGDHLLPLPEVRLEELEAAWAEVRRRRRPSLRHLAGLVLREPALRNAVRGLAPVAVLERIGRFAFERVLPLRWQQGLRDLAVRLMLEASLNGAGPAPPPSPLPLSIARAFVNQGVFSIDRAVKTLGYAPPVPYEQAMERTAAWIRWAYRS